MSIKTTTAKPLFLTITQIFLGLALLSLSTHLALESNRLWSANFDETLINFGVNP